MERGSKIVMSIIVVAVLSAIVIAYYQSTSTKVVGAQCDKTKKICQVQSETTHFGGYFPIYSYYYVPFPLFGPGLGMIYPGSFVRPNVCDDCLTTITPQDEQQVLTSKAPVPRSDLPSEEAPPSESNPGSSKSGNPSERSPSTPESPSSSPESPPSEGSGGTGGESGAGGSGAGAESGGGGSGEGGGFGGGGGGGEE
jgi:uncharacterized membrane protein YgcG